MSNASTNGTDDDGLSEESLLVLIIIGIIFFFCTVVFTIYGYIRQGLKLKAWHKSEQGKTTRDKRFRFRFIQFLPLATSVVSVVNLILFRFVVRSAGIFGHGYLSFIEALTVYLFASLLWWRLQRPGISLEKMPSASVLRCVEFGTMQFVVAKPAIDVCILALEILELKRDADYHSQIAILGVLQLITTIVAFGTLFYFYKQIHEGMESFRPKIKFIAVKITAFVPVVLSGIFTNLDSVLSAEIAGLCLYLSILVIMFPTCILMFDAFRLSDLEEAYSTRNFKVGESTKVAESNSNYVRNSTNV